MGVFQEISLIIYHIEVISWDMQLMQQLLSTVRHTIIFLSADTIVFGLINIILVSPYKTSTLQILHSFNNILKVLFTIWTSSTLFHVNLILHPRCFVIQKFSHMKLIYLLLERKLVLIYWMMKILQSLMSLIQYKIHQPVINFQHRLRKMCGSLISMEKRISPIKALLMNSRAIKFHV